MDADGLMRLPILRHDLKDVCVQASEPRVHHLQCYHNEIKLYMEACLAHAESGLPAQMLVTNDHTFFNMFLKSKIVDNVLYSVVRHSVHQNSRCNYSHIQFQP